jgi:CheY-like chemotaxis protein
LASNACQQAPKCFHAGAASPSDNVDERPRHDDDPNFNDTVNVPEVSESLGDGEVVLVIDDEPSIRMLITDVLCDTGYSVLEASDGPAGLRVLQSAARIDLLITDVGLPGGMNGRQVADAARSLRPDLRVLFITGYAENALMGNGHLEKGMQVLAKPFEVERLAIKIRELVKS